MGLILQRINIYKLINSYSITVHPHPLSQADSDTVRDLPKPPTEEDTLWVAMDSNTLTSSSQLLFPNTNSLLPSLSCDFPKSDSEKSDQLKLDFSGVTAKEDTEQDDLALLCTGGFSS